jgi:hypothetical protein
LVRSSEEPKALGKNRVRRGLMLGRQPQIIPMLVSIPERMKIIAPGPIWRCQHARPRDIRKTRRTVDVIGLEEDGKVPDPTDTGDADTTKGLASMI